MSEQRYEIKIEDTCRLETRNLVLIAQIGKLLVKDF